MTPDEQQKLDELYQWMQDRKRQQISYPLDEASKNTMGVATKLGTGSKTLTQTINTAGATASVPAAYAGSIIILLEGAQYEIPYL